MFPLQGGDSEGKLYVDDVFSTYLYDGNGTTQTITNGIDLAGKGGLVWIKPRNQAFQHRLVDTARGATKQLLTAATSAESTAATGLTAFNSNGFTLGADTNYNQSGDIEVAWTFRKAPKFFDIVTYTGDGTTPVTNRQIPHSLGIMPGLVIIKATSTTSDWCVGRYSSSTAGNYLTLNATTSGTIFGGGNTYVSDTFFTPTSNADLSQHTNVNGVSYVAYLFAHDTASDGMIQCGSFVGDGVAGSGATVNLGFEPQFLLVKRVDAVSSWYLYDAMRLMPSTVGGAGELEAQASTAENTTSARVEATATGFKYARLVTGTYIYMAIRRPNKPPTTGTQVFSPIASSATTGTKLTTSFPIDMQMFSLRTGTTNKGNTYDRLRGVSSNTTESGVRLITNSTAAETAAANETRYFDNTGFQMTSVFSGTSTVYWNFRRAPGFFDVVCYTGTGVNRTVSHNLGVAPEMMIIKNRDTGIMPWPVYHSGIGNTDQVFLESISSKQTSSAYWNNTSPTSSVFTLGTAGNVNQSTNTYVAYLFATLPGVSKVGSYVGNGSSQTINCGFSAGARFVLIKRTDSTGDWYVWDTSRGIIAGNDPYLTTNTTAAEVTTDDSIDPDNSGFVVNKMETTTNINATNATYIYLAIA